MHIVFLTNEYPKKDIPHGGIGTFVHFLSKQLIARNINVTILGLNSLPIDEFSVEGKINIYRLRKSKWKYGKFLDNNVRIQKKIALIHKNKSIDIVEGSEASFAFFPSNTTYKKVIRLHGGHHFFTLEQGAKLSVWKGYQEKRSFLKADRFIAVSDYVGLKTQEYLKHNFIYTVIYNSIEISAFYKSNKNKEIANKLVFIGTICEKKGINQLLSAFPIIKQKFPDLTLEIVGRDWKSDKITSYKKKLQDNLSEVLLESITFKGVLPYTEIPKIIESAQICVYPSLVESFGLTIIEAMAMGKSIAASNIKPFNEIVGDSDSISFFNPKSIESIVETISKLLQDASLREKLRVRSRAHILHKFDTNIIVDNNINFYKKSI